MSDLPYPTKSCSTRLILDGLQLWQYCFPNESIGECLAQTPNGPYVVEAHVKAPNIARSRLRAAP